MKKIGLFGGTFDPIHCAHLAIAAKALDVLSLDKVIFIVAGEPPHKSGNYRTQAQHRLKMVQIAALCNERFEVSDYEIKKQGKSYSYLTANHFKKQYPDAGLYFIIGDEAFRELPTWKFPEKLASLVTFAVFTRDGGDIEVSPTDALSGKFIKIEIEPIKISSTAVRERLLRGEDVTGLVPDCVIEYIRKNDLY